MESHDEQADKLEHEADELEKEGDRVEGEIDKARDTSDQLPEEAPAEQVPDDTGSDDAEETGDDDD